MIRSLPVLVRREIWEHRGLWIAPGVAALLFLVGTLWGFISLVTSPEAVAAFNEQALPELTEDGGSDFAHAFTRAGVGLLYMVMLVVLFFYALDSLYSERRDRSILFWRSLPVSDTLTVLSKVLVVVVLAPLIVLGIALAMEVLDLFLLAPVIVLGTDLTFGTYLQPLATLAALAASLKDMWLLGLWFLPYFGWLFLVSAWARRAAFLWAVMPPLGVALLEWIAIQGTNFLSLIGQHISLPFKGMAGQNFGFRLGDSGHVQTSAAETTGLAGLAEPGFWIGLMVGLVFIIAAVAIRRYRGETS